MSKIKLWENTHFDKIIAVYNDGTEEEIGYINDNGDKVYYGSSPSATAPKKFHSDWNQRQYDAYKQRQKAQLAQNGRSPDFGTLLYQHNRNVLKGAGVLMRQAQERQQANDSKVLKGVVDINALRQRQEQMLRNARLYRSAGYGMMDNDLDNMYMQRIGYWIFTAGGIRYIGENDDINSIPYVHPYRILEIGTTYLSDRGTTIVLNENGVYSENGLEYNKNLTIGLMQPPSPKDPGRVGVKNEEIISFDKMKKIFIPYGANLNVLEKVTQYINEYGKEFGLDNPIILAHFLAQAGYETGYFQTYNSTENLSYSLKNIKDNFSKYFSSSSGRKMSDYVYNPEKLANVVYGSRMGNGPESTGDGWKYRGRGLLQLTGKGEVHVKGKGYLQFTKFYNNRFGTNVDFVLNPDLVSNSIETAVISGLWYFKNNVTYSQLTKNPITVKYTTEKIKGSSGTWDTRKDLFEIILNHLK